MTSSHDNKIDWQEVRQRIELSQQTPAHSTDAERLRRVLRQRAMQLATRRQVATLAEESEPWLVLGLAPERFAIPLDEVLQIVPAADLVRVPGCPPEVAGVVCLKGEVRSVVDLRRLLGLPDSSDRPRGYLLLLRRDGESTAARVDSLEGVQPIASDAAAAGGEGAGSLPAKYLKGVTEDGIGLLDLEQLFRHPAFTSRDTSGSSSP